MEYAILKSMLGLALMTTFEDLEITDYLPQVLPFF